MKKFIDNNIPLIQRIATPDGRRYQTPEGKLYPSVTGITGVLGESEGKPDYIAEWIDRVGKEVADKISNQAATRGTLIHESIEHYLQGQTPKFDMFQQIESAMFKQVLPILSDIDNIHCMETPLWSDKFQMAGTVDLIAEYKDELMVIDWKTASRYKTRDDIQDYFLQTAIYAYMFWERTGKSIKNSMIVMTTPDDGLITYIEPVKNHLSKIGPTREFYRQKYGV